VVQLRVPATLPRNVVERASINASRNSAFDRSGGLRISLALISIGIVAPPNTSGVTTTCVSNS